MDTVAYTKTGANTIIFVRKNGGKEVSSGRIVTSMDGKTVTVTEKGKDSKGQEITMIGVYDKQ